MSSLGGRNSFGDKNEWTTQEKLALASLVLKLGNNNWGKISKSLRETIEEAGLNKQGREYNVKECASVYQLLSDALQPKKKRSEQSNAVSLEPAKQIVHNLTMERMSELRKSVEKEQKEFKRMKREIEGVVKGTINHQQIRQMLEDQKQEDLRDGLSDLASSDEEDYDGEVIEEPEPSLEVPQMQNKGPSATDIVKEGELIQPVVKQEVKQGGKTTKPLNQKAPVEEPAPPLIPEPPQKKELNGSKDPPAESKNKDIPIENLSLKPKEIKVNTSSNPPSRNPSPAKSPRKSSSNNPPSEEPLVPESSQDKPKPLIEPVSQGRPAKSTVRSSPRSPRHTLPHEPEGKSADSPTKSKYTRRSMEKAEEKAVAGSSSSEELKTLKDSVRDSTSPPHGDSPTKGGAGQKVSKQDDPSPKTETRRRSSKRESKGQDTPTPQPKPSKKQTKDSIEAKEDPPKKTAVAEEKPAKGRGFQKKTSGVGGVKAKSGKAAIKQDSQEMKEPVIPTSDEYKQWKKRADLAMRGIMEHKHANIFNSPVTEKIAPHYTEYVHSKTDLESIKKDLETGAIQTTSTLCYQLNLLFCNAVMYNGTNSNVNNWSKEMASEIFVIFKKIMSANESEISAAETAKNRRSGRHAPGTDTPTRSSKKRSLDRESSRGLDESSDGPAPKRAR